MVEFVGPAKIVCALAWAVVLLSPAVALGEVDDRRKIGGARVAASSLCWIILGSVTWAAYNNEWGDANAVTAVGVSELSAEYIHGMVPCGAANSSLVGAGVIPFARLLPACFLGQFSNGNGYAPLALLDFGASLAQVATFSTALRIFSSPVCAVRQCVCVWGGGGRRDTRVAPGAQLRNLQDMTAIAGAGVFAALVGMLVDANVLAEAQDGGALARAAQVLAVVLYVVMQVRGRIRSWRGAVVTWRSVRSVQLPILVVKALLGFWAWLRSGDYVPQNADVLAVVKAGAVTAWCLGLGIPGWITASVPAGAAGGSSACVRLRGAAGVLSVSHLAVGAGAGAALVWRVAALVGRRDPNRGGGGVVAGLCGALEYFGARCAAQFLVTVLGAGAVVVMEAAGASGGGCALQGGGVSTQLVVGSLALALSLLALLLSAWDFGKAREHASFRPLGASPRLALLTGAVAACLGAGALAAVLVARRGAEAACGSVAAAAAGLGGLLLVGVAAPVVFVLAAHAQVRSQIPVCIHAWSRGPRRCGCSAMRRPSRRAWAPRATCCPRWASPSARSACAASPCAPPR